MTPLPLQSIPRATYRVQLHRDFTFAQLAELVPYLAALGISVPEECQRQLAAGVASFASSLDSLFQLLEQRRAAGG